MILKYSSFFEIVMSSILLFFLNYRQNASETGYKTKADGQIGPGQIMRPAPLRAVDAGLPLQRERSYLELRVTAAGQVVRGVRPAGPGLRVCGPQKLGRHGI